MIIEEILYLQKKEETVKLCMISGIKLKNFKAFKETPEIELKPITVLAGSNSSGKSSILQSLLLLKQSLTSYSGEYLDLNGEFLNVPDIRELTFNKPPINCELYYEFKFRGEIPTNEVKKYLKKRENSKFLTEIIEYKLIFVFFNDEDKENNLNRAKLKRIELIPNLVRHKAHNDNRLTVDFSHTDDDLVYREGPKLIFDYNYHPNFLMKGEIPGSWRRYKDDNKFDVKLDFSRGFLPSGMKVQEVGSTVEEQVSLPDIFAMCFKTIEDELTNKLRFLGPLRETPRRAYLSYGGSDIDIGNKGEYAAQVLHIYKTKRLIIL